ncbi:DnaT-like ssDNA-binding domain-containing protein [Enterobacter pseudoroggenkampii]|uniref:DnaT-like ssDNA-binding domain-containing protein n=1 Tax=Enterobacter pseudoroggenkampii TaxID=2996112 RepID=UPI0038B2DD49
MPSDDFVGQAAQWGINLGDCPGYTPVELQQFRDYWKCEGKVKHHLQWEQTFASSLKTSRAKTSTSEASSRSLAGFGISQPDTEIPPGFRG